MTTDFPTAPSAYGLNGPSAAVTVEKSPHASHTEILTPRREAAKELESSQLFMGDYTIVSPLYSEFTIPPAAMLNVMAPKIIYSFDRLHYVARGGALKSHARGNVQYNDIANHIVSKAFYRGPAYSFGDAFLHEKAQYRGTTVTPSSILKPTINAHITYMVRSFVA